MSQDVHDNPPAPWYRQLHWQITLGIVAGLIYSIACRLIFPMPQITAQTGDAANIIAQAAALATERAQTTYRWAQLSQIFGFLGDLFIRALKMIIIPLIVASVITGIRNIGDATQLGKVGARTMAYYMGTTLLAVITGLLMVNLINPGMGLNLAYESAQTIRPSPLLDVFRNIIPTNILSSFAKNDMLPSIFASTVIGVALLVVGKAADPLAQVLESLNTVVLKITDWIMATAPIGVAALFITTLLDPKMADLASFLTSLGGYMLAVILGLSLHALVLLPLLLKFLGQRSPLHYLKALSPALLTAFSTASSSATYPVTLDCVTDAGGVSKKSASFVLPLGATINMDGTALYEAVAAVFIANALGVHLSFGQQLIIILTATLAAIGAAGVPSAGLVTMIIVLESVGLPGEAYGLVIAVDRILDQCRTTVNVWGDAVGAAIVDRWMPDEPAPEPSPEPLS